MRWFAKHRFLTLIVVILAITALLFGVSYRMQGSDTAVARVAHTIVSYVQKPTAAFADKLTDTISSLVGNRDLNAENKRLKEQNEDLKKDLLLARLSAEEYKELKNLSDMFNVESPAQDAKLVEANVVAFDNTDTFNVFTIDAGSEAGIERNSVVVSGDGLVGRVFSTGEGWSKVLTVTDENNKIGFQIKSGNGIRSFLGVCVGDGEGNLTGELLDEDGKASTGELAVTSGSGGIYPAGIVIGRITQTELGDNGRLMTLRIATSVYFKGLKTVAVIV